jgi:hypothetical protein
VSFDLPIPAEAARRSGMMPPADSEMISPAVPILHLRRSQLALREKFVVRRSSFYRVCGAFFNAGWLSVPHEEEP